MRKALVLSLALSLFCVLSLPQFNTTSAQSLGGLERGYRTGYSDGYVAGYRDAGQHQPYNFRGNADFRKADRAYSTTYGAREDYRDGYQQGFGSGYDDGYQNRGYNSTIPNDITLKGTVAEDDNYRPNNPSNSSNYPGNNSTSNAPDNNNGYSTSGGNRPGFAQAAPPELGQHLYDHFVRQARTLHARVQTGRFGADMKVHLVNDGPVTIPLQIGPAS